MFMITLAKPQEYTGWIFLMLKIGILPHNFVFHSEEIITKIINHSGSVLWDYLERIMLLILINGLYRRNGLEIKALVNTTSARQEKGTYTLLMGDYLSNVILEFLNTPNVHRVTAEPIIFSPQVLSHTTATDAFPTGYAPYHILINPKFGLAH